MKNERAERIISLIEDSNKLTVEEFGRLSLEHVEKITELGEMILDSLISVNNNKTCDYSSLLSSDTKNNKELKSLLIRLFEIHSSDSLPSVFSFLGLSSIVEAITEYDRDDYISIHFDDDYEVELSYTATDSIKCKKLVSAKSLNIISVLEESEVLISSSELPGYVFALYHDYPEPVEISTNYDDLIKVMISLTLLSDKSVLTDFFKKHPSNSEFDPHNPLKTLIKVLNMTSSIKDCISHESDDLEEAFSDEYDNWKS